MLNAVLTLISVHFLISAQNNLPCRITRRANRQIYAGDVLPAYLLSAKYIPVLLPDVPVIFPGLFLRNIAVFYSSISNYTNFFVVVQGSLQIITFHLQFVKSHIIIYVISFPHRYRIRTVICRNGQQKSNRTSYRDRPRQSHRRRRRARLHPVRAHAHDEFP